MMHTGIESMPACNYKALKMKTGDGILKGAICGLKAVTCTFIRNQRGIENVQEPGSLDNRRFIRNR